MGFRLLAELHALRSKVDESEQYHEPLIAAFAVYRMLDFLGERIDAANRKTDEDLKLLEEIRELKDARSAAERQKVKEEDMRAVLAEQQKAREEAMLSAVFGLACTGKNEGEI